MLPHSPEGKETGQSAEEHVGWPLQAISAKKNAIIKRALFSTRMAPASIHQPLTQLQVGHLFCWPQAATL